jgi:hypothetical protein
MVKGDESSQGVDIPVECEPSPATSTPRYAEMILRPPTTIEYRPRFAAVDEHASISARTSSSVRTSGGNRRLGLGRACFRRLELRGVRTAMGCLLLTRRYLKVDQAIKHPSSAFPPKRCANVCSSSHRLR